MVVWWISHTHSGAVMLVSWTVHRKPEKETILTPGMTKKGKIYCTARNRLPASLLARALAGPNIVPQFLFLVKLILVLYILHNNMRFMQNVLFTRLLPLLNFHQQFIIAKKIYSKCKQISLVA